jgi:hypothetical protein
MNWRKVEFIGNLQRTWNERWLFCFNTGNQGRRKQCEAAGATSFPGSFFGEGKTLVGAGHVVHRKLIA